MSKRREKAWRAPLCLMWTLWRERNERVFNDIEWSNQALKHSFCILLEDRTFSFFLPSFLGVVCILCVYFSPLLGVSNTSLYLPIRLNHTHISIAQLLQCLFKAWQ